MICMWFKLYFKMFSRHYPNVSNLVCDNLDLRLQCILSSGESYVDFEETSVRYMSKRILRFQDKALAMLIKRIM